MQAVTLRLDEERAAWALAGEEAVQTRRELEVAVSAAVAESEAELKNLKVLRPSPCSTRLGQTRHGSNLPHIFSPPPTPLRAAHPRRAREERRLRGGGRRGAGIAPHDPGSRHPGSDSVEPVGARRDKARTKGRRDRMAVWERMRDAHGGKTPETPGDQDARAPRGVADDPNNPGRVKGREH